MAYPHNSGVLAVLLITVLMQTSAAPSRQRREAAEVVPRWHTPCHGSSPTSAVATLVQPTNNSQTFKDIQTLTEISRNATDRLVLRYINERFRSSTYAEEHKGFEVSGVPKVPDRPADYVVQANHTVPESHQWVATCIVFIEQTKEDEEEEEEEYGTAFITDTRSLLDFYYNLLCKLEVTLSQLHLSPLPRPSAALFEQYQRAEATAVRHMRGYFILRDCHLVLSEVRRNFLILARMASQPTVTQR